MKKKICLLLVILALFSSLTACGKGSMNSADAMVMPSSAPSMDYAESEKGDYAGSDNYLSEEVISSGVESPIYTNPDAKVIRTASLTIQTTEFEDAVSALARLTEEQGGYYESARVDGGGVYDKYARRTGYYVIRIPKENFLAFRNATGSIGHLYSITEETVDVGEEYYDTESRLATLRVKHDRLLVLLEKAEKMEDIISLENALADIQYQIDRYTSTLRKYDSLIGYSTFTVWLEEVTKITTEPSVKETFGNRLLANLKAGLDDFGEGVEDLALWFARNLIGIVLFVVIVGAGVYFVRKSVVRRKNRNAKKSDLEE